MGAARCSRSRWSRIGELERGLDLFAEIFDEAVAQRLGADRRHLNYNEIWTRAHVPIGASTCARPARALARSTRTRSAVRALAALGGARPGDPAVALEQAEAALAIYRGRAQKFEWRAQVAIADALLDLDRVDEAACDTAVARAGRGDPGPPLRRGGPVGIALGRGRIDEAAALGEEIAAAELLRYPAIGAMRSRRWSRAGGRPRRAVVAEPAAGPGALALGEAPARIALARGDAAGAAALLERGAGATRCALGLVRWARPRALLRAEALAGAGDEQGARRAAAARRRSGGRGAARTVRAARRSARASASTSRFRPSRRRASAPGAAAARRASRDEPLRRRPRLHGPRRVGAPAANAEALATLHRLAVTEVGRRHGIVDKFAGDAVMATFNRRRALDHTELAAEAALALRDKAALLDIPIGIGIAVGPAVVGRACRAPT